MACLEGLAKTDTWQVKESTRTGSVGRNLLRDDAVRSKKDVLLEHLLPPLVHAGRTEGAPDRASVGSLPAVEPASPPGGVGEPFEDQGVRLECSPGLALDEHLGGHNLPSTEGHRRHRSLGLRLQRGGFRTENSESAARTGSDAVSSQALGAVNRSVEKAPRDVQGEKARTLEFVEKPAKIREVGTNGKHFQQSERGSEVFLSNMRSASRGLHVRPRCGHKNPRSVKRRYLADIFSGSGGVARKARQLGFNAREWEIDNGIQYDVTSPKVENEISSDILRGRIISMMIAPPCTTFSRARDRTAVLRDPEHPWGLPAEKLSEVDRIKVIEGNRTMRVAIRLAKCAHRNGPPWIFENPDTSKCWYIGALKKLAEGPPCRNYRHRFLPVRYPMEKAYEVFGWQRIRARSGSSPR